MPWRAFEVFITTHILNDIPACVSTVSVLETGTASISKRNFTMTYIPNSVTAPGQLVVINPITGTPLEAGNPKYPMGSEALGAPGILNPNIFSNFYVTVELQEFTPVWQQAIEKTHRFNQTLSKC